MTTADDIQNVSVMTSLGDIPVKGIFDDRLRILCITGMFSVEQEMEYFPVVVGPDFAGMVARLPGHGGPVLAHASLPHFAQAFDELAEQLGPQVVVGLSAGGLVAMAMRHAGVRSVVAADPPLETSKMWMMREVLRQTFQEQTDFHTNFVGYTPEAFTGRCYLDLLDDLRRPTYFVVGDMPLFPVRRVDVAPSLVDEPTRRLIASKPLARLRVAAGVGHLIRRDAGPVLLEAIREACAEAQEAYSRP